MLQHLPLCQECPKTPKTNNITISQIMSKNHHSQLIYKKVALREYCMRNKSQTITAVQKKLHSKIKNENRRKLGKPK